ncbi:hypothetical protein WMF39_45740 [Sorangium sp. So ce1504]|uniref:hypothetical protein n=1 Tax=Sorangium sp. So ce1504 TaxID=3133337 RepID=UPI003F61EA85
MNGDPESALARQFRELAGAPKEAEWPVDFHFNIGGYPVRVTYSVQDFIRLRSPYVPGAQRPVDGAQVAYREPAGAPLSAVRPMSIELRPETSEHGAAKAALVSTEVQTGDSPFDHEVYIHSPSDPHIVQRVLGSPELRASVRELLAEGFSSIDIDDERGEICAHLQAFADRHCRPGCAARMLDAFATIARNVPHVGRSSALRPADTGRTLLLVGGVLCAVLLLLGAPVYFFAAGDRCDFENNGGASVLLSWDGCFTPVPLGLAAGLPVGLALAAAVSSRIRGRSDSHERASFAHAILVILAVQLAIALSAAVMWAT